MKESNIGLANTFFYLYCISTLFVGTSVKSFLGIQPGEGLLQTIHIFSLPFLLVAYAFNWSKCNISKWEKLLVSLFFVALFVSRVIVGHSANIGLMINILLEPILLISYLRSNRYDNSILSYLLYVFLIVESLIGIYEVLFSQIVFMRDVDVYEGTMGYLRAYSLHGHPLQNAFLVCLPCITILYSNKSIYVRYPLFVLCFLAVLAFNTRSSVIIMGASFFVKFIMELIKGKTNIVYKAVLLSTILISALYLRDFVINNDIGTRMEIALDKNDGSANARFQLIKVVAESEAEDILFGKSDVSSIINKYSGMATIENSFLIIIFYWGIFVVFPYFILLFRDIKDLRIRKSTFYPWVITFFVLLNVNNVLGSDTPALPIALLALIAFSEKDSNVQTLKRNCS